MSLDRREFLKQVAAYSAGAAIASPLFTMSRAVAQTGAKPVLVVGRGTDYPAVVASVLSKLGGMGQFIKAGQSVVIKPNIGWDRKPEQGANTHPLVVQALVRLALDQQAGQVLVFDRSCNDPRRCYNNSGILDAVESLHDKRARCSYIDDKKFVPVQIKNGKALSEWPMYKDALEADVYINVPIAKHHGLSKLTLGLKNIMGVIGGGRGKIHQEIAQKLADLNTVIRPALTVIDATRILLRGGPQGGNLADVKQLDTIIASTDPVAADAYATTLFGMKPGDLPSTVAAHAMGLGEMDLSKVKIIEA